MNHKFLRSRIRSRNKQKNHALRLNRVRPTLETLEHRIMLASDTLPQLLDTEDTLVGSRQTLTEQVSSS